MPEKVVDLSLTEPQKGVSVADVNLLIFVPCYGGVAYTTHVESAIGLMMQMKELNIKGCLQYAVNESLIPRARNRGANALLDGDPQGNPYTHLLFLDADIGFNAQNIFQAIGHDKDIVALPYTAKCYDWTKIVRAVKNGIEDPQQLERCGGRPIINAEVSGTFSAGTPIQFPQLGTGLLLTKRKVFEKMAEDPARKYKLMNGEQQGLKRDYAYDFFQIGINPETGYYDSEDYRFCLDARKLGFETWLLPWAVTSHTGPHTFLLDIPMMGQANVDLMSETKVPA